METSQNSVNGSATIQSRLWGTQARDWADIQEGTALELYEAVLSRTQPGAGTNLLDVGCGAGMFCRMAAERGATITGLDAAPPLIAIARERVPDADLRVGEMEELPYADESFDLVTGFNSFQFAANPVKALGEAHRVLKRNGRIVISTWGKPEDAQAAPYLAAVGSLLPPPPPGAPGPFALSKEGALEAFTRQAGFCPEHVEDVLCVFIYPDESTALRGLLSAGPATRAIESAGQDKVREVVSNAVAPFRTSSGGYRLENKFRFLMAARA